MTDSKLYDLNQIQKSVGHLLNEFRKSSKLTDVELDVGGKLFPAHRAVLSLYSPVLEAAVSDQWSTTRICPISDEYVDAEIMEDLLNFLYTGKIEFTPENTHSICVAAHFLQIPMLLNISAKHLCNLITVKNVLTLFQFSINCQLKRLRRSCLQIVKMEHDTLFHHPEILQLPVAIFRELIVGLKILRDGPAFRKSTFHCIVRWVENNLPERLNDLPFLLENIPFEELSHKFVNQTVSTHKLVLQVPACAQVFINASVAQQAQKRFVVIEGEDLQFKSCMTIYDSDGQVWRKLPNMNKPRAKFSATVINQQDIIVGGRYTNWTTGQTTDSVEMFDWDSQTWKELFRLPERLGNVSPLMAVHNNHLYVAGGKFHNNMETSNAVLCFSFETKQWKYVEPMNFARSEGSLISHKNHLYAIGKGSDTIERYDPALDKWTVMTTIKRSYAYGLKATLHQDKIYLCGMNGCLVYDPESNGSTTLPKLDIPLRRLTLESINEKLLVVGNSLLSRTGNYYTAIYEFNPTTMQWKEIRRMENVLEFHCCVVGDFS